MPIEIRELVIRANVSEAANKDARLEALLAGLKKEVVEQCLEQIREHIALSSER